MNNSLTCQQPDRDCPGLICGYPLPCPHHTVVIETDGIVTFPPEVPPAKVMSKVIEITEVLKRGT